jgi:predicted PurR-regulated permease PerM
MVARTADDRILPPLWVLVLMGAALLVWLLYSLKELVVLLLVSYYITYLINPLLNWLEEKRIRRGIGVIATFGVAVIVVSTIVVTAAPTIGREYEKLATNLPSYVGLAKDRLLPFLTQVKGAIPQKFLPAGEDFSLPEVSPDTVQGIVSGLGSALLQGYSFTLAILNLLLLPFIVFYLAVDFDRLHRGMLNLFPRSQRARVRALAGEIDHCTSAFMRGQLIVGAILFVLYGFGLGMVGVELWLLLALISGFGHLIPYFGFFLGIVLSSILALATFGDFSHVAWVLVVYIVVQSLEGWVITPWIVGDRVGLSPLAILIALLAGGKLLGILGIMLAIPVAAIAMVMGRHLQRGLSAR